MTAENESLIKTRKNASLQLSALSKKHHSMLHSPAGVVAGALQIMCESARKDRAQGVHDGQYYSVLFWGEDGLTSWPCAGSVLDRLRDGADELEVDMETLATCELVNSYNADVVRRQLADCTGKLIAAFGLPAQARVLLDQLDGRRNPLVLASAVDLQYAPSLQSGHRSQLAYGSSADQGQWASPVRTHAWDFYLAVVNHFEPSLQAMARRKNFKVDNRRFTWTVESCRRSYAQNTSSLSGKKNTTRALENLRAVLRGIVVFQDMVGKVAAETLQSVATASITPAVSKAMARVQQARKRKAEGSGGGSSDARSDVPVQAPANAMAQAQAQAPAKTAAPATTAAPANGSSVAASAVTGGQGKGKDPEHFEGEDDHFALMELDANKLRAGAGAVKRRRT